MGYKIAIDGPSGSGKGYVASEIAKKLGILNIDTGAMYRAFGLYVSKNNIDLVNEKLLSEALQEAKIDLINEENKLKVFLNGKDVSSDIRTEEVGMFAAKVSALPLVRKSMVERQRNLAGYNNVVMEGRDIGSVVFPEADLKIFLTADVNTRAKRRLQDLLAKGKNVTFEEVLEDIKRRDEADVSRTISPLIKTQDMIEVDTTKLTKQEVVDTIMKVIEDKGLI